MTMTDGIPPTTSWYALSAAQALGELGSDAEHGLSPDEVQRRITEHGSNVIATEPPPTLWDMAKGQLANPMNIMLLIVSIASFVIGQFATGAVVMALVLLNVIMGTNQERKAMASVEALAELQVPTARVRRSDRVEEVDASGLVPGDILLLEAGDIVPADARILNSASLEVQEASLTGESAPIGKDAIALSDTNVPLGDRTNLVFQNTLVTRGSATVVVVATGASTQMGHIADMVAATKRVKSPLQIELDGLTKIFGFLAWGAVAIIAVVGIARGQDTETLILLCITTAISAIPTGLPTFVQLMLSSGAQRLAEHKAVVKSLTDVETLGGTTVINSDKTGTLTMNAMTATTMLTSGKWYTIEGSGYAKTGAILGPAGRATPD
ncbi:MAG: HAD-IC family P-type ATPase, partial [Acidimicrobiia bacterium]